MARLAFFLVLKLKPRFLKCFFAFEGDPKITRQLREESWFAVFSSGSLNS